MTTTHFTAGYAFIQGVVTFASDLFKYGQVKETRDTGLKNLEALDYDNTFKILCKRK